MSGKTEAMTTAKWELQWATLMLTFGDQPKGKSTVYFRAMKLDQIPQANVEVAVTRCLNECTRFPVPRDLLDRIPGHLSDQALADAAWRRVLESATNGPGVHDLNCGWLPSGEGLTPTELDAIHGKNGLKRLYDMSEDGPQLGFARRDFIASFKAVQEAEASLSLRGGARPELVGGPGFVRLVGGSLMATLAAEDAARELAQAKPMPALEPPRAVRPMPIPPGRNV